MRILAGVFLPRALVAVAGACVGSRHASRATRLGPPRRTTRRKPPAAAGDSAGGGEEKDAAQKRVNARDGRA